MLFLPDGKSGGKPVALIVPAREIIAGLPRIGSYVLIERGPLAASNARIQRQCGRPHIARYRGRWPGADVYAHLRKP